MLQGSVRVFLVLPLSKVHLFIGAEAITPIMNTGAILSGLNPARLKVLLPQNTEKVQMVAVLSKQTLHLQR